MSLSFHSCPLNPQPTFPFSRFTLPYSTSCSDRPLTSLIPAPTHLPFPNRALSCTSPPAQLLRLGGRGSRHPDIPRGWGWTGRAGVLHWGLRQKNISMSSAPPAWKVRPRSGQRLAGVTQQVRSRLRPGDLREKGSLSGSPKLERMGQPS